MTEKSNIGKCRSCGVEVVWVKTKNGKNMPVDIPKWDLQKPENMYGLNPATETMHDAVTTAVEYNADYMVSHFATCPKAGEHRKKPAAGAEASHG